ncbi:MAG: tetratricopeptide repeat protein [candidate division KSB1 bacterium]|nr:tetratricopeptide repeat protein [candidate division KSB1 bacterium]
MSALTAVGILIAVCLAVLAVHAARGGRMWLAWVEFAGVVAVAVAAALGPYGTGPEVLAFSAMAVVSLVLCVNAGVVVYDFHAGRTRRGRRIPRAGVFYRMISEEGELRAEVAGRETEEVTEGLQALELWKSGNDSYLEGRYLDALSKYDLSGRWVPSVAAYVNASAVCLELEKLEDAVRYADLAISLDEESAEAWQNRALALDRLRDLSGALSAYRKVVEKEPANAAVFLLMGRVLRRLGQLEEAAEALDQGLELDPENPELLFEKSLVLIRQERREEALPYLEGAVRRNPKHHAAYFHLANALNRMGRVEEALHYYELVVRLRPEYPEAWNNRGIALSKLGKTKKAIESYLKAITLRPEYHEAWINLGLAYDSLGKSSEAIHAYRRFLELAPKSMVKHIELTRRRVEELERVAAGDNSALATDEAFAGPKRKVQRRGSRHQK